MALMNIYELTITLRDGSTVTERVQASHIEDVPRVAMGHGEGASVTDVQLIPAE